MSERNIEIAGWEIEELVRSDIQAKDEVFRLKAELAKANDEIARLKVAGQVADKLNVSFETALGWSDEEIVERVLDI